jgi:site-specific DNA-methyltransferase (adenine-specific)
MIVKEKIGEGFLDLRICDNLELMAEIEDNTIDLIYCDILYGTGRKFKDYQDLKPIRSEIESHYITRIKEMHRILKPTGSIYLQMDFRINHWVRCIMDDVFGYDNFRNEIIQYYSARGGTFNHFTYGHQNIYWYSKSNKYTFNKNDVLVNYKPSSLDPKKYRTQEEYEYVKNKQGMTPSTAWLFHYLQGNSKENLKYATQKPKALIERIIKASSNEGDLVADFYSGSFTTAAVCKDLNRSFIGCDINPNCFEKAKERGLFSFTDEPTKAD